MAKQYQVICCKLNAYVKVTFELMSIDILDLSSLTAIIKALKSCNDDNVFNNTEKLLNHNNSQDIVL
ncbi:hypothetical protein [Nostoc sp. UHCC 0302]|uniref:hypothetical protein n=1 Tax=Nostoc sp. UHCC 0302 TaxID=3134896 RepID=UPI00311CA06F